MVVHIDGVRSTFIDAIDDIFIDILCDLPTEKLEELYNCFVIYNVVGMKVSIDNDIVTFSPMESDCAEVI